MTPRAFYLALAPWLAFAVADRSAGVGPVASAVLAAAIGVALLGLELIQHRLGPLSVLASVFFGALASFSWAAGAAPPGASLYRPFAAAVLAIALALSLLGQPVTCRYTGEDARRGRVRTGRWALALGVIAASGVLGTSIDSSWAPTVFNWLLPILVVGLAVIASSEPAPSGATEEEAAVPVLLDGLVRTSSGLRLVPGERDEHDAFS